MPTDVITIESCVCWWEFLDAGPFLNTGSFVDAGPFLDAGPTEFLVLLRDGKALALFPLDAPLRCHVLPPLDNDFGVYKDGEALPRAVRDRLKRLKAETRPQGELCLNIPYFTEAERWATLMSGGYLCIPADPEHLPGMILQLSSVDTGERMDASENLRAYPGPSTIALLKTCLADTARSMGRSEAGPFMHYPVRDNAWRSLQALGVDVAKPDLYDDFESWCCSSDY